MTSRKILHELPKVNCTNNIKCWCKKGTLQQPEILSHLIAPPPTEITVFKEYSRRYVFRIFSQKLQSSFVIKSFPFKKFYEKRRYKKYGLREFQNYHLAANLQIPVPECYAYFERRRFGLVEVNGIILEDLQHHKSLHEQYQNSDETEKHAVLLKAIPVILLCFQKGVNHIDLTPHNILLDSKDTIKILDWHYCKFVKPLQPTQLLFHAAHFLRYANVDKQAQELWLAALHQQSAISIPLETFIDKVSQLIAVQKITMPNRLELKMEEYIRED